MLYKFLENPVYLGILGFFTSTIFTFLLGQIDAIASFASSGLGLAVNFMVFYYLGFLYFNKYQKETVQKFRNIAALTRTFLHFFLSLVVIFITFSSSETQLNGLDLVTPEQQVSMLTLVGVSILIISFELVLYFLISRYGLYSGARNVESKKKTENK